MSARSERLEKVYEDTQRDLLRYLRIKLQNAEDADDMAQECFLRIYRYSKFMTVENTRAFLFTVAGNLVTDRARLQLRQHAYLKQIGNPVYIRSEDEDIPAGQPSPEAYAAREEELALVLEAIDDLSQNCRQALIMHRFGGMSHQEIAEVLNVSKSMIEKYVAEAMVHLHRVLV